MSDRRHCSGIVAARLRPALIMSCSLQRHIGASALTERRYNADHGTGVHRAPPQVISDASLQSGLRAALAHGEGQLVEYFDGAVPVDTGVSDGLAVHQAREVGASGLVT